MMTTTVRDLLLEMLGSDSRRKRIVSGIINLLMVLERLEVGLYSGVLCHLRAAPLSILIRVGNPFVSFGNCSHESGETGAASQNPNIFGIYRDFGRD